MQWKTVLILANSVKKSPGRCIAGREVFMAGESVTIGPWIRPVSPDGEATEGELLSRHRLTADRSGVDVLSIFEIPLARQRSDKGQPENWEVVTGMPWKRLGSLGSGILPMCVEHPPHLWDVDFPGARSVRDDAPLNLRGNTSLFLIRPEGLRAWTMRERKPGKEYETTTFRGGFTYEGRRYEFDITDDSFAQPFRAGAKSVRSEFTPPFGDDCALCVSLGAPWHGYHYKLIAAVIPFGESTREAVNTPAAAQR